MSEQTEVVEEQVEQSDAEALAAAMAGYNARGGNTPPAAEPAEQEQQANAEQAVAEVPPVEEQQAEQPAPVLQSLEERLAAFKAEVKQQQAEFGHDAVRKLNSEVGAIKRHLKELEPKAAPAEAPVDDELTAAIHKAEEAAKDFPDLAGPLVDALKVMGAKASKPAASTQQAMSAEEISALAQRAASEAAQQARVTAAQEALAEEHPDWETVRGTPGFQSWLASKPAEYKQKLETTWNPLVVSKGLSEYKDTIRQQQQAKQQKENRLAGAITPRGVPTPPAPSKLSDEEGFARGYAKAGPRPLHKR